MRIVNPLKALANWYIAAGRPMPVNPFKRTVHIVYRSVWLHGTYVFTFKAGERNLKEKLVDHMLANMPEMSSGDYSQSRANPMIYIVEVY
jgi:hypothetical protein